MAPKKSKIDNVLIVNVLLAALLAALAQQVLHESIHAITVGLVGADVERFNFWGVLHSWPTESTYSSFKRAAIAGVAALVDILISVICITIFPKLFRWPILRLVVFYFGAYSLFSGFGYLFFDPIFANAGSVGDWAQVVTLLNIDWPIRTLIICVGAIGTMFGYFWMGSSALQFTDGNINSQTSRKQIGILLCIIPYIVVNTVFSILTLWHPVGTAGVIAVLLKLWFGYSGFFWAFMIKYIWSPYNERQSEPGTALPKKVAPGLVVLTALLFSISLVLLSG